MTETLFTQRIRNNFSAAAHRYEQHAALQQEVGLRLLESMEAGAGAARILDVGMGTGWLTHKLSGRYPQAEVVGVDFSAGMIDCARQHADRVRIVQADARALPFCDNSFDVVFSNVMYQWVDDVAAAFGCIYRVLAHNGMFYFSCFGSKTLQELFASLNHAQYRSTTDNRFFNARLADTAKLEEALRCNHFDDMRLTREVITVNFAGLYALLRWLKDTGANSVESNRFIGRNFLRTADEFYRKNFSNNGTVVASFELITGKARKK